MNGLLAETLIRMELLKKRMERTDNMITEKRKEFVRDEHEDDIKEAIELLLQRLDGDKLSCEQPLRDEDVYFELDEVSELDVEAVVSLINEILDSDWIHYAIQDEMDSRL